MQEPKTFVKDIIRPTLMQIGMHSDAAEQLLIATAIQESELKYRRQLGGGPGLGLYQMEPNTHKDIWINFLKFRPSLAKILKQLLNRKDDSLELRAKELEFNDRYSTAMARIHYARVAEPLPKVNDILAMARYWKLYYNSALGLGTEEQFIKKWNQYNIGACIL